MSDFFESNTASGVVSASEIQAEVAPPPLPHFDEEATLLSAQPVVPIEVAKASGKRRSFLVQAAMILVAALLGATGALSINFFQRQQPSATTSVVEPPVPMTQPTVPQVGEAPRPASSRTSDSAVSAPTAKATVKPELAELDEGERVSEKIAKTPAKTGERDKAVDLEIAAHRRKVTEKRPEEADQPQQATRKRRVRDADQIAERPRDASRIREIFEGPRPF